MFDIHYEDKVYLSGTKGSGDNEHDVFFYREADCNFKQLTLDASGKLADESSQRLEPYDTHALQPFDISYLSGFYADRYDVPAEQLHTLAISRAENLFNAAIKDTVQANNVTIVQNAPERQILKADYAMLPAWFLTFRYQQKPYTILVNGQTGKVVGGVPYNKSKVAVSFILTGLAVSFLPF